MNVEAALERLQSPGALGLSCLTSFTITINKCHHYIDSRHRIKQMRTEIHFFTSNQYSSMCKSLAQISESQFLIMSLLELIVNIII